MTDKITKDATEWKEQLTPEQYDVCINKEQNHHFPENTVTVKKMGFTNAFVVESHYSIQIQNLIQVLDGRVFGIPFLKKK